MSGFINKLLGNKSNQATSARRAMRHYELWTLAIYKMRARKLIAASFAAAAMILLQPVLAGNFSETVTATSNISLQTVAGTEISVRMVNGDLVIHGTDGADHVTVSSLGTLKFVVTASTDVNNHSLTKTTTWQPRGGDVFFYGNKGNDKFINGMVGVSHLRVHLYSGDGDDTLNGSWGPDNIYGGNGRDEIQGHTGNDLLDGGMGNDYIDGATGDDTIICGTDFEANMAFGGKGNDTITGSYGSDALHGGGDNDTIDGSYGEDYVYGDGGNDNLRAGNDSNYNFVTGGDGSDLLVGSYNGDDLLGNAGDDFLFGIDGDDLLDGGSGWDDMYGGNGNDFLIGGNEEDEFYGQAGRDSFHITYPDHWWPVYYDPPPRGDFEAGELIID